METFIQPKITGYRQLNEGEAALMNLVKEHAKDTEKLCEYIRQSDGIDPRWLAIGVTDLQKGFMFIVRAIAKPESF